MKKLLFVLPRYFNSHYTSPSIPIGVSYLMQALHEAGMKTALIDMDFGYSDSYLKRAVERFNPDIIAVSMFTSSYLFTYDMMNRLKSWFPDIPLIVGGPHASTFKDRILEDCPAVSAVFCGEGEKSLIDYCRGNMDAAGMIWYENGVLHENPPAIIEDIDSVSFPRYKGISFKKYYGNSEIVLPVVSSRGCPYACIYCPVKSAIGRKYRARSAQSVFEEFEYWYKQSISSFRIADDNFTLLKERVHELCDLILKSGMKLKISCDNGVRADRVDYELLRHMKEAGFYRLSFGVESASDHILKTLKKSETVAHMEKAVSLSVELGFETGLFFIIGSPGETESDVEKSIEFVKRHNVAQADFYNLVPFPGTELYSWVETNSEFLVAPEKYLNYGYQWKNIPLFETPEFPAAARKKMFKKAKKATMAIKQYAAFLRFQPKYGMLSNIAAYLYVADWFRTLLSNRILSQAVFKIASVFKIKK